MKIAISIAGSSMEAPFDPRFGRAAAFCLIDSESGEWTAHKNPALSASGGAGVQAAQFIAKLGAQAVLSGAFGPNAFDTLAAAGIEIYIATSDETLNAAQVLGLFKAGKLERVKNASQSGHHEGAG